MLNESAGSFLRQAIATTLTLGVAAASHPRVRRLTRSRGWHYGLERYLLPAAGALSSRLSPNPLTIDGLQLWHDPSHFFLSFLSEAGYEPELTRLLPQLVRPGANAVDVGASLGYYTLLLAKRTGPTGHVWAFEPEPGSAALLQRSVTRNGFVPRVTLVREAVAGSVGRVPLYLSDWHTGSNSLFPGAAMSDRHIPVAVTSLDAYFASLGWPPISLIKMDIEGGESGALAGMEELSARNRGLRLVIEVATRVLDASNSDVAVLLGLLRRLGFSRFAVIADPQLPIADETSARELMGAPGYTGNWLCEKPD